MVISSNIKASLDTQEWRMLSQYQYQAWYDASQDDSKSSEYIIQDHYIKLLNDLYLMGRTSYCKKAPTGCPCKDSPINETGFYYDSSDEDVVSNVQGCSDKILGSYENYDIELNLNEFISLFNFLGELEQENSCSGFCAKEDVYYFHDITLGPPKKSWDNALVNDVIPWSINLYASQLILISAILFLWLFVHIGLFKKEKKKPKFTGLQNTTNPQNVTQISRMEEESQVSRF